MVRTSPQTERLVEVVEMLTDCGTAGRSLAEIARHLCVDKATCYPMLMELTRVGWLHRHPRRKTFHLGPRLVAVGRAAETAIDIVDLARDGLGALADRTGTPCLAIAPSGEDLVVAAIVTARGQAQRRALGLRAGDRIALRPPLGSVLIAWSPAERIGQWLDRRFPDHGAVDERSHYEATLDFVRDRGYAVEEFPPSPLALGELLEALAGSQYGSSRAARLVGDQVDQLRDVVLVGDLDPDGEYWPVSINAPVFDRTGNVALALCIVDLHGPLSGHTIAELGQDVAAVAQSVTDHANGRGNDKAPVLIEQAN